MCVRRQQGNSLLRVTNSQLQARGRDEIDYEIRELSVAREVREESVFREDEFDGDSDGSDYTEASFSEASYSSKYSAQSPIEVDPISEESDEDEYDMIVTRGKSKSMERNVKTKAPTKATKAKAQPTNTRAQRTTRAASLKH